jgi:adenine-specific DNA-methyltransferase
VSKGHAEYTRDELLAIIEGLKSRKKFGLVWEDKPESVVQRCQHELPILAQIESRKIISDRGAPTNYIIEGDNFHTLSVLSYTHADSVSVIYIDPPYNTGHEDFIYNDNYVEADDTFRHSKWLSFMGSRLKLARNLLATDGMIFVSIDDNEMANLRLLLDEVFGEENFINCITVKTKSSSGASGGGEDKKLKKNIEYLLWYAKNRSEFSFNTLYVETPLEQVIADKEDEGKSFEYRSILLEEGKRTNFDVVKDGSGEDIKIFKHSGYKVASIKQVMASESLSREATYQKYFDKVFRTTNAQSSIRTRVMDATDGDNGLFSIEYIPKSGRNKGKVTTNYYMGNNADLFAWLSDTAQKTKSKILKREKLGTLWDDLSWNGLANEGGVKFAKGKKPLAFIQRILELVPNTNGLVLDFFAGSGTTGHATLLLNAKDGGNRRFILGTNDEAGIAHEITYPRIKNAIKSIGGDVSVPANLRYFKTEFVERQQTDDQTRVVVSERSTDLICLREDTFERVLKGASYELFENAERYTAVLFDQDDFDEFIAKVNGLMNEKELSIYVFSLSSDTFDDSFTTISRGYRLCPVPDGIMAVYKKIFKEKNQGMGA